MNGLVIKNTGNDCWVRASDGKTERCKVKGNFRIKGIKSTNPIAVGDWVTVDSSGFISEIFDRKNYIIRRSINLSKQVHIIAANVDLALLVVTVTQPETSTVFIDRFIASAETFFVPVVLIFNKIDLLDNKKLQKLEKLETYYEKIGYCCIRAVASQNIGIEEIKQKIDGKVALLSGNSGVGKSTIINSIAGSEVAKTSEISLYHQKGTHTTTFSEIFCAEKNTFIIDTPGIKGFGMVDIKENEVGHYFTEIFAQSKSCRFPDCTHRHEPDCAVLKAVEQGKIADWRYRSYISVIEDIKENKYR
ncbi:MAG: ribosome small subunit-dependent GTPase A [Prevotellaceae bacterium]|jgi:ribosome biogenesis GTPase|nr:ribosome small subunit-dependent GTPase A [Prevotellaceae bacterium]